MKKFISFLLTVVVSTVCMAQSFTYYYNGVEFKGKISGGAACIKSFNNKALDVTIPAVINHKGVDYPVRTVSVFMNGVNYTAENLVLEEGIEEIDKFCFVEFRKLQSVTLPSTLRRVGKNAFRDNNQLTMNILASIDEAAIRNGYEVNVGGLGGAAKSFASSISNKVNGLISQTTGHKQKDDADELRKQLKEQEKQLKEQQEILAKAERQEKNDKPQKNGGNHSSKSKSSGVMLADVDMNIPVVKTDRNSNTYCVIIANEKYADVPEVEFAERDGNTFREYCIKTLGIPEKQVKTYINASYTDIKRALTWVETMSDISDGNSKILFYYAGHGIPNEKDKTAYLIPTDGFPKDVSTCFKLSELYSRLGKMKSESVTVLLDACFSGVKRGSGQALVAARGVAIKPREEVLPANMVVFTAASDDETALAYQEKRHGMFTYFLLDNLKRSQGNASFGDIFKSVSTEVKKNSMLENEKLQSPSVNVSANLKQKWEKMKF